MPREALLEMAREAFGDDVADGRLPVPLTVDELIAGIDLVVTEAVRLAVNATVEQLEARAGEVTE
jgi:hypothetical protein